MNKQIESAIKDSLENKGYDLVQVSVLSGGRTTVEISIDRKDENPVSVDDCTIASRLVSAILDVEDIVKGKYNLNLCSPGEYRLISSVEDFKRFCGKEVKLELHSPIDGNKKISGKLMKVEQISNDTVVYLNEECDTGPAGVCINYNNIKKASVKRIFKI